MRNKISIPENISSRDQNSQLNILTPTFPWANAPTTNTMGSSGGSNSRSLIHFLALYEVTIRNTDIKEITTLLFQCNYVEILSSHTSQSQKQWVDGSN